MIHINYLLLVFLISQIAYPASMTQPLPFTPSPEMPESQSGILKPGRSEAIGINLNTPPVTVPRLVPVTLPSTSCGADTGSTIGAGVPTSNAQSNCQ